MMEFGLFSILLGLIGLASFIWLVIVAFRQSVIWGFLVFLFSPISAIAFSIYHWNEARKPFLVYFTATIVFFAMFFSAFSKMGGLEMIETTHEAVDQLEKGEITEVEAARRVAEQAESSLKRMEEAGVIGMNERKLLEEKVQELKLDETKTSATESPKSAGTPATSAGTESEPLKTAKNPVETTVEEKIPAAKTAPSTKSEVTKVETTKIQAPKAGEQKLEFGPDWSLEGALEKKREKFKQQQLDLPNPKIEGNYVPISVSRAKEYVGQQVRVIRAKTRHDGLLKSVNENHLILDMQVSGGQAHFEIKRHQIQEMYQLIIPNPEEVKATGNK